VPAKLLEGMQGSQAKEAGDQAANKDQNKDQWTQS
jgi:hypothetical protein